MLKEVSHSVAWNAVCQSAGLTCVRTSLRMRGAGYRRDSSPPEHINPNYNRHRFRHILVAYSPGGIIPLPFEIWVGFSEYKDVSPYQMGMVRFMLWESCAEDWAYLEQVANSLLNQYGDDVTMLAEALMLKYWLQSCLSYSQWHIRASYSYSITARDLLDPPAVVFRPDPTLPLSKSLKYGRMFRCYDLIRSKRAPPPLEALEVHHNITVVTTRLWLKSDQWLGGIVTTGG